MGTRLELETRFVNTHKPLFYVVDSDPGAMGVDTSPSGLRSCAEQPYGPTAALSTMSYPKQPFACPAMGMSFFGFPPEQREQSRQARTS